MALVLEKYWRIWNCIFIPIFEKITCLRFGLSCIISTPCLQFNYLKPSEDRKILKRYHQNTSFIPPFCIHACMCLFLLIELLRVSFSFSANDRNLYFWNNFYVTMKNEPLWLKHAFLSHNYLSPVFCREGSKSNLAVAAHWIVLCESSQLTCTNEHSWDKKITKFNGKEARNFNGIENHKIINQPYILNDLLINAGSEMFGSAVLIFLIMMIM